VVVGPVDTLFGIAADQVHATAVFHRPGHFRARDGQRRQRPPAALLRGARGRAVGHRMGVVQVRQVDPPWLREAFELAAVMRMGVALRERR